MRAIRKRVAVLALVVALALAAAACGGSSGGGGGNAASGPVEVRSGGTLTFAADQEPPGFNVNTTGGNTLAGANVVRNLVPTVFVIQPDFTLKLNTELMDSVELTRQDPQTVVYKIKPTATWDDGVPISADDFSYLWQNLNGSNKAIDAKSTTGYEDIAAVTGSDNGKTVTVVYKKKFADWKALFSMGNGDAILPAHTMRTLPGGPVTAWNHGLDQQFPVSGGPFRLESYTPGSTLTLVRNDRYYGAKAHLDRITFRFLPRSDTQVTALQNNEVQLIYPQPQLDDVNKVKGIAGVKYEINFGLLFEHLDFNFKTPGLGDPAVRKAIATGLDGGELVNATVRQFSDQAKVLGNRIWLTNQPQYQDHSGGYAKGDLAGAQRMLEQAGYVKGPDGIYAKDGQRLSYRFTTTQGNQLREDTGVLFQSQMRKLGVDIRIDNKNSKTFFGEPLPQGDFDIALFAWVGSPFAISGNRLAYRTGSSSNYGKYANARVDQLFDQALQELDEKKVADLGNQIDQQLWADMATIPLYQKPTYIAYYDKYGNIRDNSSQETPFYNSNEWGLKK